MLFPPVIGSSLGVAIFLLARMTGFASDRSFYPTVMVIIASYYVLFATMAANHAGLVEELVVAITFSAPALAGYYRGARIAAATIFAHGIYDPAHGGLGAGHGAPEWWPVFYAAIDIVLGCLVLYGARTNAR